MYCCLYGEGDLLALAFEFSPVVERSAANAVTFDASGLDRLFGLQQDVAIGSGMMRGDDDSWRKAPSRYAFRSKPVQSSTGNSSNP